MEIVAGSTMDRICGIAVENAMSDIMKHSGCECHLASEDMNAVMCMSKILNDRKLLECGKTTDDGVEFETEFPNGSSLVVEMYSNFGRRQERFRDWRERTLHIVLDFYIRLDSHAIPTIAMTRLVDMGVYHYESYDSKFGILMEPIRISAEYAPFLRKRNIVSLPELRMTVDKVYDVFRGDEHSGRHICDNSGNVFGTKYDDVVKRRCDSCLLDEPLGTYGRRQWNCMKFGETMYINRHCPYYTELFMHSLNGEDGDGG